VYDRSKLLPKSQFQQLCALLPTPRQKRRGRKHLAKEALLTGILQVLVNGCSWKNIADCGASYVSCFRYLQELQRRGKLKFVFQKLAREKVKLTVGSIDTTLIVSFAFRYMTGNSGKHRAIGTKVSLFCDQMGLPADVLFGKGNVDDKVFVKEHIKNTLGKRKKVVNLDKGYISIALRRAMRTKKIRINMETRRIDYTKKRGPVFRFDRQIYKTRFELEKLNGWVKAFRALRLRRSYHPANFKAFVYLALIIVLIRNSYFCNEFLGLLSFNG
jgi:transposase